MSRRRLKINGYRVTAKRFCAALCFLLFAAACQLPTVRAANYEQRLAIFDAVWQSIGERYYDPNLRGVDWRLQREIYRRRAAEAPNDREFYRVLRRLIGVLHDSHTRVYAPDERSDWRNPRAITTGISPREIENKILVAKIDKTQTGKARVQVGDEIVEIDNQSIQTIIANRIAEQTGASTEAARRLKAVAGIFEGAPDSFAQIKLRDAKGRERIIKLLRARRNLPATFDARRADSTLILTFDAFAPETVREFYRVLNENLRGVRSIILDLRGNRGGSAEAMTDIASAFLPANRALGKFVDRTGKNTIELETRPWLFYTASSARVPALPIVILTSTATASAAEIFATALKQQNRAKLIGTTTCGCVLAVKGQQTLPDGGALEISEYDFRLPDNRRLEGIGQTPDEIITPTRQDLLDNRDRALMRALELLDKSSETRTQ